MSSTDNNLEPTSRNLSHMLELVVKTNELKGQVNIPLELVAGDVILSIMKNSIQLDQDACDVLMYIIKHTPEHFNEIESLIISIIKDNKIDSTDVPNLIHLIEKLYEVIYKLKDVKQNSTQKAKICGSIIKFIVHVLVTEGKIKIDPESQTIFLANTDKLIDSCVSLLKLSKTLKGGKWFNCFTKK